MSSRPLIAPNLFTPLINAADMTTQIIGKPTAINMLPGISYDISWTGDPEGTFEVQVSNTYSQDSNGNTVTAGNWQTLPPDVFVGTYPIPTGTPGTGFLDVVATFAAWIRLVWIPTAGTGELTIIVASKVL